MTFYYDKLFELSKSVISKLVLKRYFSIKNNQQKFSNGQVRRDLVTIDQSYEMLLNIVIDKLQNSFQFLELRRIV